MTAHNKAIFLCVLRSSQVPLTCYSTSLLP